MQRVSRVPEIIPLSHAILFVKTSLLSTGTLGGCLWSDHRLCQAITGEFSSVCKRVLSENDFLNWPRFSSPEAPSAPHSPFTFSHSAVLMIYRSTSHQRQQHRNLNNNIWKHVEGRMSNSSFRIVSSGSTMSQDLSKQKEVSKMPIVRT